MKRRAILRSFDRSTVSTLPSPTIVFVQNNDEFSMTVGQTAASKRPFIGVKHGLAILA